VPRQVKEKGEQFEEKIEVGTGRRPAPAGERI